MPRKIQQNVIFDLASFLPERGNPDGQVLLLLAISNILIISDTNAKNKAANTAVSKSQLVPKTIAQSQVPQGSTWQISKYNYN